MVQYPWCEPSDYKNRHIAIIGAGVLGRRIGKTKISQGRFHTLANEVSDVLGMCGLQCLCLRPRRQTMS